MLNESPDHGLRINNMYILIYEKMIILNIII